jgi:Domain of unknown function (DUF4203)
LVERLVRDQEAVGSNPTSPIRNINALAQRAAVLVSRAGIKYKGVCHKRLDHMALQNPSIHFSVAIVGAVIGAVILLFGRKLFWLCVAAVGFAAGVELAPHLVHEPSPLLALTVALVLGLIGALLALFLQKIAIAVLGFLAGGKLAGAIAAAFFIRYAQYSTFIFLAGGVVGAILLLVLFDWALIVVSSLIGAHLIQGAIVLPPSGSTILFIGLAIIGIMVQAASLRRSQT